MESKERCLASTWVFKISRWFGVIPCDTHGNISKAQTVFSAIWTTFLSMFVLAVRFYSLYDDYLSPQYIHFYKVMLVSSLQFLAVLTCCLNFVILRKHAAEFETLIKMSVRTSFLAGDKTLLVVGVFLHNFMLLYVHELFDPFFNLAIALPSFWSYMMVLQFRSIISVLREKMESLVTTLSPKNFPMNQHGLLIERAKAVNEVYAVQLFLIVGQIFGYTVSYTFNLFDTYAESPTLSYEHYDVMGFYIAVLTTRILMLFIVANCCHQFEAQMDSFYDKFFKLLQCQRNYCENRSLTLYIYFKMTHSFTACGFIRLNYSIVTSVIAAALTYLAILVQFSSVEL